MADQLDRGLGYVESMEWLINYIEALAMSSQWYLTNALDQLDRGLSKPQWHLTNALDQLDRGLGYVASMVSCLA